MLSSELVFPMGAERESSSLSAAKSGLEIELTPETGERARAEIKIVSELFEAAKGNTTGKGTSQDNIIDGIQEIRWKIGSRCCCSTRP